MAAQKIGRTQWLAVMEALYTDQVQWSVDGNIEASVAKVISLADLVQLKKNLEDPSINEAIDRDVALGTKLKVESTPTFYVTAINKEQRVVGGLPYSVLKQFFDGIVK
jgi:protein-disulfide isomerase